jgi:hypothetical protein
MNVEQGSDPGDTQTLYREAMDAFAAADSAAKTKPPPGSPAWTFWQTLVQKAVAANEAFIARIVRHRAPKP